MMQQIREMMSIVEAPISTNPKEAQAHYTKMEPLWTRLQAESKEDTKAKQDKTCTDWAKRDTNREKKKADMKAFNGMMERREAERKVKEKKRMAERKAEEERSEAERKFYKEKRMAKRKAYQEKREAERKAYEEKRMPSGMPTGKKEKLTSRR
jgi:hypothetical protein